MITRSSLLSHAGSTQTVPGKVHAIPFTRKALSFPRFRRTCLRSSHQFSLECQICTFDETEFHPVSFPTSNHLEITIFSTVVGLPIWPVLFLESAVSTISKSCRVWPPYCKMFLCGGQGQETLVNTALPPLPELRLNKFSLQTIHPQPSKDAFGTSIL